MEPFQSRENVRADELLREQAEWNEQKLVVSSEQSDLRPGWLQSLIRVMFGRNKGKGSG